VAQHVEAVTQLTVVREDGMSQNRIRSRIEKAGSLAGHTLRALGDRRRLRTLARTSAVARGLVAAAERRFDAGELAVFDAIEERRRSLYARRDEIVWSIEDPIDPAKAPPEMRQVVGWWAKNSSTKPHWGRLLYAIVREVAPQTYVELGACFGMSGLYIQAALKRTGGRLITCEGSRARAEIAAENFRAMGFSNHEVVVGDFDRTLPEVIHRNAAIDMAFIDGNHHREPTLRYDTLVRGAARDNGVILHDDIRWSGEMIDAWREVAARPATTVYDGFRIGVIELGSSPRPERVHTWFGLDHLR
jgi:predicted O-methyltransferase YrrM